MNGQADKGDPNNPTLLAVTKRAMRLLIVVCLENFGCSIDERLPGHQELALDVASALPCSVACAGF